MGSQIGKLFHHYNPFITLSHIQSSTALRKLGHAERTGIKL